MKKNIGFLILSTLLVSCISLSEVSKTYDEYTGIPKNWGSNSDTYGFGGLVFPCKRS